MGKSIPEAELQWREQILERILLKNLQDKQDNILWRKEN